MHLFKGFIECRLRVKTRLLGQAEKGQLLRSVRFGQGDELLDAIIIDVLKKVHIRLLKRLRDINFEDVQKQKNLVI